MKTPRRVAAAVSGVALLAQSCIGSISTPNYAEGEQVLRAVPRGVAERPVEPVMTTEPIRSLAILTVPEEPPYATHWNPRSAFEDSSGREGMGVGFLIGLNLVSMVPLALATPFVIGGIMGASTIGGGIAGLTQSGKGHWKPPADQRVLESALARIRPETQVREEFRDAVAGITRGTVPMVERPADQPKDAPADYAELARAAGTDAVADLRVVAFGVAGGDAAFTVGVFAGVRARVFRASDGALIYDKLVAQSPEVPLPDAPPPGTYTLELMSLDEGRVFQHEVNQALRTIARALATDPDLRIAPR